jgi:hypothetical protein
MQSFDQLPKSIKKSMRYINQDAPIEKLYLIKYFIDEAIRKRVIKETNRTLN